MSGHVKLSSSAGRVQEALAAGGFACEVKELPQSTRTAVEAAKAIGCQVGQIVKSLIFRCRDTGRPILVIASGPNRVSEKRIAREISEALEKADADFVRQHTGYAIGGVPPVGLTSQIITFIDEDLLQYEEIWAAAGTPHAVFCLTPDQLVKMAGGRVMDVKG